MWVSYSVNKLLKVKLGVKMTKVIFFFAGTGDDGENYRSMKEDGSSLEEEGCPFPDNVIRIYIKGCQEKRVGNGFLFPDLGRVIN